MNEKIEGEEIWALLMKMKSTTRQKLAGVLASEDDCTSEENFYLNLIESINHMERHFANYVDERRRIEKLKLRIKQRLSVVDAWNELQNKEKGA